VSAAAFNPTPESRRRFGEAKHPVLARLPDVSVQPSTPHCEDRSADPVEYVDYRFDAPAGAEDQTAPVRRMTRPHSFERASYDAHPRSPRRASYIQPDSDPFSLPTTSLYDRLAPVARFLVLFALFTAAGTAFLMRGGFANRSNSSTQTSQPPAPAPSTHQRVLEPAAEEFDSSDLGSTTKKPTANGPSGTAISPAVDDLFAERDENPSTTAEQSERTTPGRSLVEAVVSPLPRVQTTDSQPVEVAVKDAKGEPAEVEEPPAPPVIARLPGIILEVPARQAEHVNNQPGLH
jgi:hypothetical protein